MSQPQTNKNKQSLPQFWTVWILVAVLTLGGSGFWGWKYMTMSAENERFELSIKNTSQRIKELQPGDANLSRQRSQVAKKADKSRVNWSEIMTQVMQLETKSARFAKLDIDDGKVSAMVNSASWEGFSEFINGLESSSEVSQLRVSSTSVLSPAVAGATQEAKVSFLFTPKSE